ncbi:hypothetical protein EDC96DRAFT_513772, partial [Choanephora cucurbitarum]
MCRQIAFFSPPLLVRLSKALVHFRLYFEWRLVTFFVEKKIKSANYQVACCAIVNLIYVVYQHLHFRQDCTFI